LKSCSQNIFSVTFTRSDTNLQNRWIRMQNLYIFPPAVSVLSEVALLQQINVSVTRVSLQISPFSKYGLSRNISSWLKKQNRYQYKGISLSSYFPDVLTQRIQKPFMLWLTPIWWHCREPLPQNMTYYLNEHFKWSSGVNKT